MKLHLLKGFLEVYDLIRYWGISKSSDHQEKDYYIMINQYFFLMSVIFVIQGFTSWMLLGFQINVVILWSTSFASVFAITYQKNYIKNKIFIITVFIYLTLLITYYSLVIGSASGCFLYYFSLLSAIPIFFNTKKDKKLVILIFSFVLCCIYISAIGNFQLWGKQEYLLISQGLEHTCLLVNITCQILLLPINYFFLVEKRNDYYNSLARNEYKNNQIANLSTELKHLRNLISKEEIIDEELKDLLKLISVNDILFLERFERYFPYFKIRLLGHAKIHLSTSELMLCAASKLGLSTKEIAFRSNTSSKAIEGRKYRLRKKLHIPSELEFATWFLDF